MLLIRLSVTSSCFASWSSVSKSDLSSVSPSVVLRPQKKVGGSWRFLAFCSSSGVGFISHTTWQSDSSHETCKHLQNKWRLGWVTAYIWHKVYTSSVTSMNLFVHEWKQISGQITLKGVRKQTGWPTYHHQKMQKFSHVWQGAAFLSRLWAPIQNLHLGHYTGELFC